MSALVERLHLPRDRYSAARDGAALLTMILLIYYCIHPAMYAGDDDLSLLESRRTYIMVGFSALLIAVWLIPNRLSDKMNRRLSWAWFCAAPFAVYFSLLYLNADKFNIDFFELDKIALVLTFVFLYLVQGILFGLTGSIRFSVMAYALAIALLGIANCFVISFRGQALSAADLFSVSTAATVASEYTYTLDWYMFMELMLTFGICTVSLKLRGGRMMPLAWRAAFLGLFAVIAGGYYYLCCKTDFLEDHDIRSQGFTHQLRYKKYDMLFTTLTTCFYLSVDKPEGYSLTAVEEIATQYVDAADDDAAEDGDGTSANESGSSDDSAQTTAESVQTPDIIVIMNESFADYESIGRGLNLSEDNMPFIHSLTENTIKGTAYSSVFGGNTPNSEYEFLTGNTMGFLPESSVGFNLFVRGDMPSLASQLDTLGYYTLAMHPYRGTNYRRNIVYPQIGFDEYYTREDFQSPSYIRSYISDATLFDRIIQEYEDYKEESDSPFLSYNVTIQNHGGYYTSNTRNLPLDISVLNDSMDVAKATIYVNLIKQTDTAFEELITYFEQVEDPVVVIMFGDHQANLGDSVYNYLIGKEENLTQEELMEKYKIPFIVWANYDIEEETIEKTSLNYLYSIIADRLGLSMTGYQEYLLDLSEKIPVINSVGYWGDNGEFYELDDKDSPYYELINEYNILEYNYIFGGDDRYLELLTLDAAGEAS